MEFKILHIAVEKYQMSWCLKLPKSCVHFFFDFMIFSYYCLLNDTNLFFSKICWWHWCKQSMYAQMFFFFINRKLLSVDALEIHCFLNYKLQTKIWHAVGNSYVNFDPSLLMITVNGLEILILGKRLIKEKWAVSFSIACLQTLQTLSLQAKGLCIALRDAYFLFNSLT